MKRRNIQLARNQQYRETLTGNWHRATVSLFQPSDISPISSNHHFRQKHRKWGSSEKGQNPQKGGGPLIKGWLKCLQGGDHGDSTALAGKNFGQNTSFVFFDHFDHFDHFWKNDKICQNHEKHDHDIFNIFENVKNMKSPNLTNRQILKTSTSLDVGFFKNPQNPDRGRPLAMKWPPPRGDPPLGGTPPLQGGTPLPRGGTIKWPPPPGGGPKKWTPLPRGGGIYIYNIYIGFGGSQNDHFTTTPGPEDLGSPFSVKTASRSCATSSIIYSLNGPFRQNKNQTMTRTVLKIYN